MVTLIEAVILAIIQGLTEWLPVSSSGHLVITQKLLGISPPLLFDAMLHVGTVVVVLFVFRKDIWNILRAVAKREFDTPQGKLALYIIIGSVPIGVLGFVFSDFFEALFDNLPAVGLALLITGCVLFVSEKKVGNRKIGILDSVLVGLAQAAAIIPGISRSGVTVSAGLLRGIDKTTVFRYSFLLSVLPIIGATLFELKDLSTANVDIAQLFIGTFVSMVVGYVALKALRRVVISEKFHLFAYYCWAAGVLVIVFVLIQ
ncbi:MAG: undecaprenyl-diphosphate phosphatase [Candidatus Bathyarchaeia archaeon]|jgi:undecaprenyl-diphosphatase